MDIDQGLQYQFAEISLKKKKPKKQMNACITLSQTTNFRMFQIERGCRRQFQI